MQDKGGEKMAILTDEIGHRSEHKSSIISPCSDGFRAPIKVFAVNTKEKRQPLISILHSWVR